MIRVKKSFTLIELVIVIVLISTVYLLMFSNTPFLSKTQKEKFSLVKTKEFLIKNFEFKDEVSLLCVEKNLDCFVRIDGIINEEVKIKNIFSIAPEVYEYNNSQERVYFGSVSINNFDTDVIFEFKINSDYKFKEYIVDTLEDRVYVFNSIFQEAKVYNSLNEAFEVFEKNILEVKDAF